MEKIQAERTRYMIEVSNQRLDLSGIVGPNRIRHHSNGDRFSSAKSKDIRSPGDAELGHSLNVVG